MAQEFDRRYGLTVEEMQRRRVLLKEDPAYRVARNWFMTSLRVQHANDAAGIMMARENLIFSSADPERVIQQAAVAYRTGRRTP